MERLALASDKFRASRRMLVAHKEFKYSFYKQKMHVKGKDDS